MGDERVISNQAPKSGNSEEKGFANPPSINLPKGGGAIRGIDEKFTANPATGTGSLSIPIATSPGRSGFAPQLSLSYDSGSGNGPFGFGWNLSIPSITRKNSKGLPKYQDENESDVFILSGAEDLVPTTVVIDGNELSSILRTIGDEHYEVFFYRPRIEGLFARIERWKNLVTGKTHWRSISKDNITTLYGKDENSRIADPENPLKIFNWLICESHDDKGNVISYEYQKENLHNVGHDLVSEGHRVNESSFTNQYLKRVKYGNLLPYVRNEMLADRDDWLFEVVFDYEEGHYETLPPDPQGRQFVNATLNETDNNHWPVRQDPISSYRAGFEIRTYRLCHRVLMFHHFPEELETDDYLVRSTDFTYEQSPIASFITEATQSGYTRQPSGEYLKKSFPPVEFGYTKAEINETIQTLQDDSYENLPIGLDSNQYQWVDLDGEGLSGVLCQSNNAWYYKPNLGNGHFGDLQQVPSQAATAVAGNHQLLDLAGDGSLDVVHYSTPITGFYEREESTGWKNFQSFSKQPNVNWNDPNLRFVDLTGDGHADILITENEAFTWYQSLAEEGYKETEKVRQKLDEDKGPHLVFADGTQSIYLADISGDGLSDLLRIRNGEVCYWPNLGYGRFGSRVVMDNAPWFDHPDQFDQRRIRLTDIDGSGIADILYLGSDGIKFWYNHSGNGWSETQTLSPFLRVDNLTSVTVIDLKGNGTACLVWSSPLPQDRNQPLRYIDLMGGKKPHLLISTTNNMGAETHVSYAASTKFYLKDREKGQPWVTKIPFPVHVVEKVETRDQISKNRFVTRYAYHHGYFDGIEREFRGFGMVEQWDTEAYATLSSTGELEDSTVATNIDAVSHVPPVHTKTWFHTGAYVLGDKISLQYLHEYYGVPDRGDVDYETSLLDFVKTLLPDTILPDNLSAEEAREACRALKGSVLRQEIYGLDDSEQRPHPYSVAESNFTVQCLQPEGENRNGVFFTHPREVITYNYERNPGDPRIGHQLTLEVDSFGNVLKSVAIGYGRNPANVVLTEVADREKQTTPHITYTENGFTNAIRYPDDYRAPLPSEMRTYELTGYLCSDERNRYQQSDFITQVDNSTLLDFDSEILYHQEPIAGRQRRLIEHVRTLYRADDLSGSLLLGELEALALPHESYKLALTPELVSQVYQRGTDGAEENLLAEPDSVLGDIGGYVHSEGDSNWWIRSGKVYYYSPDRDTPHDANAERAYAEAHFFLPHRFEDPFGNNTDIVYDTDADNREYNLLVTSIIDPLDNQTRVEHDYRVLQPWLIIDPNHNHSQVVFDTFGMVVGSAVMGKVDEEDRPESGDSLEGFVNDPTSEQLRSFMQMPRDEASDLLGNATTRIVYDIDNYINTDQPVYAATIARENHVSDDSNPESRPQVSFSYSDGFGREIQKKIQAEPGSLDLNDPDSPHADPRWVGSGWTIFNNKGKPVRQYEPFFSPTHDFELARTEGVSPILFYDPVGRVVATLHPNNSYEKVIFDPWRQITYDVNDTVCTSDEQPQQTGDPRTDPDIAGYVDEYFKTQTDTWQTWYQQRIDGAKGANEQQAAEKAAAHANTPSTAYLDSLGRPFLTVAHNRVVCSNHEQDGTEGKYVTRVELDIEGNQRSVRDAKKITRDAQGNEVIDELGRIVMRYDYDMLGNHIHQISMEAGERWMLNDVRGSPIRAWDSRGHSFRTEYDPLRRPVRAFVQGAVPDEPPDGILYQRTVYGEDQSDDDVALNLRTRVFQQYDGAGVITNMDTHPETGRQEAYDFKGNLLRSNRQLIVEYKEPPNWSNEVSLEENENGEDILYTSSTSYDALNRPVEMTTPDNSVTRPGYNEANLLEHINVNLHGSETSTVFVENIDYDAKGQRTCIEYGCGVTSEFKGVNTTYTYDPLTFRLINLKTARPVDGNHLASDLFTDLTVIQDLSYTYDPAGNITHKEKAELQSIFHSGQQVEPVDSYTYDALYRLIEARGREHIGQTAFGFNPPDGNLRDYPFAGHQAQSNDLQALRNYTEFYEYDAVGNFEVMRHRANGGSWARHYDYEEDSLIEAGKQSNRLSSTRMGNGFNHIETYTHDIHGNMTAMQHLPLMEWDFMDQLQASSKQVNNGGTPETTYYVYDASGQRVRKVTELQASAGATLRKKNERIYLGGFEIYREYNGAGEDPVLERETLHVMDDKQRIALVETKTIEDGNDVTHLDEVIRFQFNNHLGSSSVELDERARVISYEEYYPYGSGSYQAVSSGVEVSAKRYRYTGMERDEESGLNYHGARYYAGWLGKWISTDPIGLRGGMNLYQYSFLNPIMFSDTSGLGEPEDLIREFVTTGFEYEIEGESGETTVVNARLNLTEEGTTEIILNYNDEQIHIPLNNSEGEAGEDVNVEYLGFIESADDVSSLISLIQTGSGAIQEIVFSILSRVAESNTQQLRAEITTNNINAQNTATQIANQGDEATQYMNRAAIARAQEIANFTESVGEGDLRVAQARARAPGGGLRLAGGIGAFVNLLSVLAGGLTAWSRFSEENPSAMDYVEGSLGGIQGVFGALGTIGSVGIIRTPAAQISTARVMGLFRWGSGGAGVVSGTIAIVHYGPLVYESAESGNYAGSAVYAAGVYGGFMTVVISVALLAGVAASPAIIALAVIGGLLMMGAGLYEFLQ